jgi:hypothetical protein
MTEHEDPTAGGWIDCALQLPPDGKEVRTKVHDLLGKRNEQTLKRRGVLWFIPSESVYVYYTPTHWRPL